jgi:hypothetical protein
MHKTVSQPVLFARQRFCYALSCRASINYPETYILLTSGSHPLMTVVAGASDHLAVYKTSTRTLSKIGET